MSGHFVESAASTEQGKCPSCGGSLAYSPENEKLLCGYCGTKVEFDLTPVEVKENDFREWSEHPEMQHHEETVVSQVACGQCGAHTTFPENVTSFSCAFCGTPIALKNSVSRRAWKPEYILPFKIGKEAGNERFSKWISSLWFTPSKFSKTLLNEEHMKGLYLPYWTYDANTETLYRGERGTRHTVGRRRNGNRVNQTVTRWSSVSGRVSRSFDDILVPASDSLPAEISKVLTNWDRVNYVSYKAPFVYGFLTEMYKYDFKSCYKKAQQQMGTYIDYLIHDDIGGHSQRIHSKETVYSDVKFKHVLLPVWLSAYRYKNKSYVFVINGRTGQVFGQRPWSIVKIALIVFVVIAVILFIFNL